MSAEDNKALLHRLMDECFTQGNLALVDELFAPDWVNNDPSLPELRGRDGARQLIALWRNAFADLRVTIDDMVAEGEKVAGHFTIVGTHQGDLMGIAPTATQFTSPAAGTFVSP